MSSDDSEQGMRVFSFCYVSPPSWPPIDPRYQLSLTCILVSAQRGQVGYILSVPSQYCKGSACPAGNLTLKSRCRWHTGGAPRMGLTVFKTRRGPWAHRLALPLQGTLYHVGHGKEALWICLHFDMDFPPPELQEINYFLHKLPSLSILS